MEKALEKLAKMNLSDENQKKLVALLTEGKKSGKVSSKLLIETLDAIDSSEEQTEQVYDLLEQSGFRNIEEEQLRDARQNLMVTPRDIDAQVRDLAKVIGYGINWALQDLEIEEINALLS